MSQRPFTILCLASEFKGVPFILEAKRQGARVVLITAEIFAPYPWPWDSIDIHFSLPNISKQPDITNAVSYLARGEKIDRIVALDDYDVATVAALREHLRLPGMNESTARHFRDKLAMRVRAHSIGLTVPAFTGIFNYDDLRAFMAETPPPWVLKPRFEAGAVGIQKIYDSESAWRALDILGDQQSFYLLEQFVAGDVYHVDSIVWAGDPLFTLASRYGAPPLAVVQGGGIFATRVLGRDSAEARELVTQNSHLLQGLGHPGGIAHTEFIRDTAGTFHFLETAARVGGANIDRMVKAATDIDLWTEAARIELALLRNEPYTLPPHRNEYAGLITSLSKQTHPDLSSYDDPEIRWRLDKPYHAGLLVASPSSQRVTDLVEEYSLRFIRDFLQHTPTQKDARTNI